MKGLIELGWFGEMPDTGNATSYAAQLQVRATGRVFWITADSMTSLKLQIIGLSSYCDLLTEELRA